MHPCKIDIEKFELEPRNYAIFYSSDDFIVYKQGNLIKVADCDGTIKYGITPPPDWRHFEVIDLDDKVLIIFAGKDVVVLDKYDGNPLSYSLDHHKIGKCTTSIFAGSNPEEIVFGTYIRGGLQVLTYNYMQRSRVCQSASMKMSEFTDFRVYGSKSYSLMDNTYIVCTDILTGETIWKRFETSNIKPKLQMLKNNLIYTCHGAIKQIKDDKVDNLKIPFVKVSSIELVSKNYIYFTCNDNATLMCYDNKKSEVKWEIKNLNPIQQSVHVVGMFAGDTRDLLVTRAADQMSLIDLSTQQVLYRTQSNGISRIRQTGQHILLHKNSNQTDIIAGVK